MLLSMLVKLYNQQQQLQQQQQLELHQQQQQQQQLELHQQPDDQTLATMIAAKQLLQLGRQQDQEFQHQHHHHHHQQQQLQQQQQQQAHQQQLGAQLQPFDLSLKSPMSSLNNSTGTTASSPPLSTSSQMTDEYDDGDMDSLDLVKHSHHEDDDQMHKAVFKPQPFKIIRDKDNNFSCQYCSKKYQSMGALKMHVRTHTLPCQCKICGKSFSRPWLLQGHIRTHTGEKPFKCDQCHRAFADRSNLRAHLQTHAKVKKYSCKCCLKTFSRMSLQVKHEEHCNNNNTYVPNVDITSTTTTPSNETTMTTVEPKTCDL